MLKVLLSRSKRKGYRGSAKRSLNRRSRAMNSLYGRIDSLAPQTGLKPVLRGIIQVDSRNEFVFDVIGVIVRSFVSFSEGDRPQDLSMGEYLGEAYWDSTIATISPGSSNSVRFLLPLDFGVLEAIENRRKNRDVILNLGVRINGRERLPNGSAGDRVVVTDLADTRNSSMLYLSFAIAKSKWDEFLAQWGYSDTLANPLQQLSATIKAAQEARRAAEEAAKAAQEASDLTAVTGLSEAYLQEARELASRSSRWAKISLCAVALALIAMSVFVWESVKTTAFSLPQAIIRAVVILALFGVFTLCLRIYESYRHLEVVNRHRVNIGRTFEAFKAAQPSDRAKDIMSAITAENMLAFGKSGFAGKDTPNQGPLPGIAELIKAVLEKHSA
jgi:uncharacterized membrane protein